MIHKFIKSLVQFNYKTTKLILCGVIIILSIFQLATLRYEFVFLQPGNEYWAIHHDEKLLIPDARFIYLKDKGLAGVNDYKPCLFMSLFGVAGPAIVNLGFNIFGMNNFGLRFFFSIISCIISILFVLCALKIAPGKIGIFFSLLYIFSYDNFVLQRHAILENILSLYLISLLCLYITRREVFLKYFYKICFLSGSAILFKPNFAIYLYLFIFIIFILENYGFKKIGNLILWSAGGLLLFESLQLIILIKYGLAKYRYDFIFSVIVQHLGFPVESMHTATLRPLAAIGMKIFKEFPMEMFSFFITMKFKSNTLFLNTAMYLFIFMLILLALSRLRFRVPNYIYASSLLLTVYLIISAFFYFYPKRAVAFYPLTLVILAYLSQSLSKRFFKSPKLSIALGILLAAFLVVNFCFQFAPFLRKAIADKDIQIEKNSASLNQALPKGSVIYSHCYGYRFLWMAKDIRFLSGDDEFMNNSSLLNWAVKDRAKYVILSERGKMLIDFEGNFNRINSLIPIATYESSETESDDLDKYHLMEVTYK